MAKQQSAIWSMFSEPKECRNIFLISYLHRTGNQYNRERSIYVQTFKCRTGPRKNATADRSCHDGELVLEEYNAAHDLGKNVWRGPLKHGSLTSVIPSHWGSLLLSLLAEVFPLTLRTTHAESTRSLRQWMDPEMDRKVLMLAHEGIQSLSVPTRWLCIHVYRWSQGRLLSFPVSGSSIIYPYLLMNSVQPRLGHQEQ